MRSLVCFSSTHFLGGSGAEMPGRNTTCCIRNFKFPSSHIRKVQSKNLMFCFIQYIQYYLNMESTKVLIYSIPFLYSVGKMAWNLYWQHFSFELAAFKVPNGCRQPVATALDSTALQLDPKAPALRIRLTEPELEVNSETEPLVANEETVVQRAVRDLLVVTQLSLGWVGSSDSRHSPHLTTWLWVIL